MKVIYIALVIFLLTTKQEVFAQSPIFTSEPIAKTTSMYWGSHHRAFFLFQDKCPQKDLAQRYGYRAEFHDKKFQTPLSVVNACYFRDSNTDVFFMSLDGGKEIRMPYGYFESLEKTNVTSTVAAPVNQSLANNCYQSLEGQQSLLAIKNKVPLSGGRPTLDMLANDTKPTKIERKAIADWEAALSQCNEHAKNWSNANLNPQVSQLLQNNFNALRSLIADLYAGKISYGKFLKDKQVSDSATSAQITEVSIKIQAENQRRTEENQRQLQFKQQQQQAQQQAQQAQQQAQQAQLAQQQAAEAAYRQQQLNNAAQLLRGDGSTVGGGANCYMTPGGPSFGPTAGGMYCR